MSWDELDLKLCGCAETCVFPKESEVILNRHFFIPHFFFVKHAVVQHGMTALHFCFCGLIKTSQFRAFQAAASLHCSSSQAAHVQMLTLAALHKIPRMICLVNIILTS